MVVAARCFESDKAATDTTNCLIRDDPSLMLSIVKEARDPTFLSFTVIQCFYTTVTI